jgi:hypothetical protein
MYVSIVNAEIMNISFFLDLIILHCQISATFDFSPSLPFALKGGRRKICLFPSGFQGKNRRIF